MFYLVEIFRTKAREAASQLTLRELLRGGPGGAILYRSFLTKGGFCGCCSVFKPCPALCDSIECSTSDLSVLHCPPEFAQIHVP